MNLLPQLALPCRSSPRAAHVRLAWEMACLAALALTHCFGCGVDSPPAAVEGTVRLDGKLLDNCLISFFPEPGQGADSCRSTGLTDRRGSYRLRCDNQREGAAVGWHRVTVQDLSVSTGVHRRDHGAVDLEMDEATPAPPVRRSRVAARYASLRETPLRRKVERGAQVIHLDVE